MSTGGSPSTMLRSSEQQRGLTAHAHSSSQPVVVGSFDFAPVIVPLAASDPSSAQGPTTAVSTRTSNPSPAAGNGGSTSLNVDVSVIAPHSSSSALPQTSTPHPNPAFALTHLHPGTTAPWRVAATAGTDTQGGHHGHHHHHSSQFRHPHQPSRSDSDASIGNAAITTHPPSSGSGVLGTSPHPPGVPAVALVVTPATAVDMIVGTTYSPLQYVGGGSTGGGAAQLGGHSAASRSRSDRFGETIRTEVALDDRSASAGTSQLGAGHPPPPPTASNMVTNAPTGANGAQVPTTTAPPRPEPGMATFDAPSHSDSRHAVVAPASSFSTVGATSETALLRQPHFSPGGSGTDLHGGGDVFSPRSDDHAGAAVVSVGSPTTALRPLVDRSARAPTRGASSGSPRSAAALASPSPSGSAGWGVAGGASSPTHLLGGDATGTDSADLVGSSVDRAGPRARYLSPTNRAPGVAVGGSSGGRGGGGAAIAASSVRTVSPSGVFGDSPSVAAGAGGGSAAQVGAPVSHGAAPGAVAAPAAPAGSGIFGADRVFTDGVREHPLDVQAGGGASNIAPPPPQHTGGRIPGRIAAAAAARIAAAAAARGGGPEATPSVQGATRPGTAAAAGAEGPIPLAALNVTLTKPPEIVHAILLSEPWTYPLMRCAEEIDDPFSTVMCPRWHMHKQLELISQPTHRYPDGYPRFLFDSNPLAGSRHVNFNSPRGGGGGGGGRRGANAGAAVGNRTNNNNNPPHVVTGGRSRGPDSAALGNGGGPPGGAVSNSDDVDAYDNSATASSAWSSSHWFPLPWYVLPLTCLCDGLSGGLCSPCPCFYGGLGSAALGCYTRTAIRLRYRLFGFGIQDIVASSCCIAFAAHQQRRELEKEGIAYWSARERTPMLPDDPREMV